MSVLVRRLILCALGALAGLAAWPLTEWVLTRQAGFPSYLLFSTVVGMVFGLFLGAFFGSSEGIFTSVPARIARGAAAGAAVGLAGGVAGFLVAQAALFLAGEVLLASYRRVQQVGIPLARAAGWAILGLFVGAAEGLRSRSGRRIGVGVLGGLIGGFLGGLALEYARLLFPAISLARLAGLVLFGLLLGFFYGLVESRLAFGVLHVLNGALQGKEYLITQGKVRIGAAERSEVRLAGYAGVADEHAALRRRRDDVVIERLDPRFPVQVNEEAVEERALRMEDVIRIGSAKFIYWFR